MNTESQTQRLKAEIDALQKKIALLKLSEERFRLISRVATDYTFSTKVMPDGTLDLNWVAGAFESISGYSVEEFKTRGGWRATIHPDDLHIDDSDFANLQNNRDTDSEIRTINKCGEIVWVQVFAHPIWDKENNCLKGIYGAVKNITDRKNTEEKLTKSESQFRELLENISLIAIILDIEGRVTFCNHYLLKITGYQPVELIGKDWFDLMIPDDTTEIKDVFLNGLKNENIAPRIENPILTKSGEKLDIVWSNVIQRKSNGLVKGVASIGENITKRKRAEVNLMRSNERLKLILENTPNAIWDWNIKTDVWYTTPNYYTMLGYQPEKGLNDRNIWLNRIHPDDRENVKAKINLVLDSGHEKYNYTARLLHADGSYRWQTVIGHVIERDEYGKAIRMLGVRVDVDETKKAEEAIRRLNMELEQKVKDRTRELEKKNADLKRMNRLFVGRELRMIELKNNIKALEEIIKNYSK